MINPTIVPTLRASLTQVYVAHLDQRASEDDVKAMFAPFGPVLNVRIIVDRDTGQSKGYGFVTMAAPAMAQARQADPESPLDAEK